MCEYGLNAVLKDDVHAELSSVATAMSRKVPSTKREQAADFVITLSPDDLQLEMVPVRRLLMNQFLSLAAMRNGTSVHLLRSIQPPFIIYRATTTGSAGGVP